MKTRGRIEDIARKLFKSKKRMRKVWAERPMEEKIKDLVQMQSIAVRVNPEYRKFKDIIPWEIK